MDLSQLLDHVNHLTGSGDVVAAIAAYETWLAENPDSSMAVLVAFNLGALAIAQGDNARAAQAFQRAIGYDPTMAEARINFGLALERMGNPNGALVMLRDVTANLLGSISRRAIDNKNMALRELARISNTEDDFDACMAFAGFQPDLAQHRMIVRERECIWPVLKPPPGASQADMVRAISPHALALHADNPMLQLARSWEFSKEKVPHPERTYRRHWHQTTDRRRERLKIAYVSSCLCHHAHGLLTAELFGLHDRSGFEIFAYSMGGQTGDHIQQRIMDGVDHWVDVSALSEQQTADRIFADRIDILIDFNGYTGGSRLGLAAMAPAPVLVNWLGFPGSLGSPYHHYVLGDEHVIPQGYEVFYTEKVARVPCYQPNDRQRQVIDHGLTRDHFGLPADSFVFCSFNGAKKYTPATWAMFMDVLRQRENSVLWLLDADEVTKVNLIEATLREGIDPARLIWAPRMNNAEHLGRYPLADLFLDSYPCGSHTTASDSLWMGVPVVTVAGLSFASRVCASLLNAAGLGELVCSTHQEYVDKAIALSNDRARLNAMRDALARRDSVLFDTEGHVRGLEAAYREMWAAYEANQLHRPDFTNMEAYREAAIQLETEDALFLGLDEYCARLKAKLARADDHRPLASDTRLWRD